EQLSDGEQRAAVQVFLRLVRPGIGTMDSRRRFPVSEINGMDVDPVALSQVLDTFGRHRLLSFDRDPISGEATVEVAHEALLREWERFAGWIERHRSELRRIDVLRAAADEWQAAGRAADYLLIGSRLAEFDTTMFAGVLQITDREKAFLLASRERRDVENRIEVERAATHRRLERRAGSRLVALVLSVLALLGIGIYLVANPSGQHAPRVSLLYNGGSLSTFSQIIEDGFDSAVSELELPSRKVGAVELSNRDGSLTALSEGGSGLVVVAASGTNVDSVAAEFPATHYAVVDLDAHAPNVTRLVFAVNEASFLAGAAAAATSRTGTIGFIGGSDSPMIWPFEAGYEAGARAVNPRIRILSEYLSRAGDYKGFNDASGAEKATKAQYLAGADVVFHAAGDSGFGVLAAATDVSNETGIQHWVIGVDSDQYATVLDNPANVDAQDWRPHILTSVIKRMDLAVHDVVTQFANGSPLQPVETFNLANHGVDLAESGGFIAPLRAMLDTWRQRIERGQVVVPCVPASRESQAQAFVQTNCTV
ncbi:MAG: BMP family ABC transporter substrate-binding protein, partial [Ilumatobacteraceae bacterium]